MTPVITGHAVDGALAGTLTDLRITDNTRHSTGALQPHNHPRRLKIAISSRLIAAIRPSAKG
ncbi:MAG: hypothetical protein KatS3mg058_3578 [Roseiflexus sp.]|nr:MAG: hypothetical protein KatS3mg058_3578 [Roseiflexus sp.]